MKDELRQQPTAANCLGDYLRGEVPINQLISQHEYILNTLNLEWSLNNTFPFINVLRTGY